MADMHIHGDHVAYNNLEGFFFSYFGFRQVEPAVFSSCAGEIGVKRGHVVHSEGSGRMDMELF